jgi:hypothetical protein
MRGLDAVALALEALQRDRTFRDEDFQMSAKRAEDGSWGVGVTYLPPDVGGDYLIVVTPDGTTTLTRGF